MSLGSVCVCVCVCARVCVCVCGRERVAFYLSKVKVAICFPCFPRDNII
jgi:hypothetical protein